MRNKDETSPPVQVGELSLLPERNRRKDGHGMPCPYGERLGGAMKFRASDLAAAVGAAVEGDGAVELSGVAAPERASSSDLIFVDSAKHAARAEACAAR